MNKKLLKLGQHSFIYAIGNGLSIAAGFILIPFYTNMFSTEEYGVLEILNRSADILSLFMFMGVRQALIRFYFEREDEAWHKTVVNTVLLVICASCLILSTVCYFLRGVASSALFNSLEYVSFFSLMLIWIPFELMINIVLTYLQINMKSILFVLTNFARLVLVIGSNVVLIYFFHKGIEGVLITNIWVLCAISMVFLVFFLRWTHFQISTRLIKELVIFGLPYLPATFLGYTMINSDRYFLSRYQSLDDVGIYALAYKLGMFGTSLLVDPFNKVWGPFLFENYNKENGEILVGRVYTIFSIAILTVGLGISVLSPIVIPLISAKDFHDAYKVVPYICLASIFYGMGNLADAGILISKKTYFKPFITLIVCAITLFLHWIFIPKYGIYAAGINLSVGFFIQLIIVRWISKRYFNFRIDIKKLIPLFLISILTYWLFDIMFRFFKAHQIPQFLAVSSLFVYALFLYLLIKDQVREFIRLVFKK